jgi:ATP-binding cassette, subfamily B, bacterial PglK
MIKKLSHILEKKDLSKIKILAFLNFLMFILEFLSIASIPVFIALLISPEFLINKFNFLNFNELTNNISSKNIIIIFSCFIAFIFLLKGLFLIFLTIFQNKFLEKTKTKISTKVFNHYLMMEYINHVEKDPAELARKITADISMFGIFIQQQFALVREFGALFVILFLLIWSSPMVILIISIVLAAVTAIYLIKIKKVLDEKSNTNKLIAEENFKTINEIFGSLKDIKILSKENDITDYFNSNIKKLEKNLFFFQVVEKIPRIVLELISVFALTSITATLIISTDDFNSSLPLLALITLSVFRFIPAFSSITTAKYYIQISLPYLASLENVIQEIEKDRKLKTQKIAFAEEKFAEEFKDKFLLIKNLNFNYTENKISQIQNINFEIKKNSTVGIVGKTGAGKSTLFYLLLGLIQPSSGSIFFNGKNIFSSLDEWRKKTGSVSQNIFLLDNTIEKNITFNISNESTDHKRLNKAIKVAQLESKINSLPNGLKTKVGNNGIKLSGGERQRLAISRLLYQDPEIIFLDESTNSLDFKTEKLILDSIKENYKDKTIIMIAHRQSLIEYCDEVWKLENGKLQNQ